MRIATSVARPFPAGEQLVREDAIRAVSAYYFSALAQRKEMGSDSVSFKLWVKARERSNAIR